MKCPYCDNEMEEGAVISRRIIPQWVKRGEKKGKFLNCKRHFTYNEHVAHRCAKCKKIILED